MKVNKDKRWSSIEKKIKSKYKGGKIKAMKMKKKGQIAGNTIGKRLGKK